MERREAVLAALAAGGEGVQYQPVHVQKLMFLLDDRAGVKIGGPHFSFTPYDYGPFDSTVYSVLDSLASEGLVDVIPATPGRRHRTYRLTPQGQKIGEELLGQIEPNVADFTRKLASWVKSQPFNALVGAIYREYPEMRARSVWNG